MKGAKEKKKGIKGRDKEGERGGPFEDKSRFTEIRDCFNLSTKRRRGKKKREKKGKRRRRKRAFSNS